MILSPFHDARHPRGPCGAGSGHTAAGVLWLRLPGRLARGLRPRRARLLPGWGGQRRGGAARGQRRPGHYGPGAAQRRQWLRIDAGGRACGVRGWALQRPLLPRPCRRARDLLPPHTRGHPRARRIDAPPRHPPVLGRRGRGGGGAAGDGAELRERHGDAAAAPPAGPLGHPAAHLRAPHAQARDGARGQARQPRRRRRRPRGARRRLHRLQHRRLPRHAGPVLPVQLNQRCDFHVGKTSHHRAERHADARPGADTGPAARRTRRPHAHRDMPRHRAADGLRPGWRSDGAAGDIGSGRGHRLRRGWSGRAGLRRARVRPSRRRDRHATLDARVGLAGCERRVRRAGRGPASAGSDHQWNDVRHPCRTARR